MEGGAGGRSKKRSVELWKNDLIYHHIDSYKVDNKNATITFTKKAISLGVGTF